MIKKAAKGAVAPLKEITARGIIIGIILCVVFTAANVYFGLKAGITFSTSIPKSASPRFRYLESATN